MHVGLVARSDNSSALDLANALHEQGLHVSLFLSQLHFASESGSNDHQVKRLSESGILPPECHLHLVQHPRMRDPRSLTMVKRLSRTMSALGPDVVHLLVGPGEIWLAVLANLIRSIPVVGTMVIPFPNVGDSLPPSVSMKSYRLLAHGSDAVIVNGADQIARVREHYGLPSQKLFYVPLCARTTAIKWTEKRFPEIPGSVLFFGRADPHKGLEYLIRAQPIISHHAPEARIIIVAHGEYLNHCLQFVQDSSKFEVHAEYVSNDEASAFFQKASLVVLPYISASTSGVLLTAYGFGKPVVATQVGCLPEYVHHNSTGLLVPPCNPDQLAGAIVQLLSDDFLRHEMGRQAESWVNQRQREIAKMNIEVYEKAISSTLPI